MAHLIENFAIEEEPERIKLLSERGYGAVDENGRLILSPLEALYLTENKRIAVLSSDGKEIGFTELMKHFSKGEKDIDIKYLVYSDLRNKGYIIKTGYGFGSYMRVYEKGIRPGEGKSHMLIEVFPEKKIFSALEIERLLRLSQVTKKNLIIAIVSDDAKIKYIKVNSIQL